MKYNRVFNQEKWDKVNKYNKNMLNDFILEMKSRKRANGTILQYKNDLRILFIYILDECDNEKISNLKKKHFRNYSIYLQELGLSSARVNRLLSALRSMLTFAEDDDDYQDDIEINYAAKVKGIQSEQVRDIIFLTDDEVSIIYDELISQEKYSQALLCAFMYDSASRRNEAIQVKRNDLDVNGKISKSYIIGKRRKKYRPIYHDKTRHALSLLESTIHDTDEDLWITSSGESAQYSTLYNWVVSWRQILYNKIGILKMFNPHSFRHSALENYSDGTHYAIKGSGKKLSLTMLQILANHSDVSTTQSYLKDKSEDELLQEFNII